MESLCIPKVVYEKNLTSNYFNNDRTKWIIWHNAKSLAHAFHEENNTFYSKYSSR